MPKHKKKFISKENSVTFHLVHRSQQDPLVTDETAPQHVLVPAKSKADKTVEEERKYGIFFDDEYDYLQHLRGTEELQVHWEETAPNSNVRVRTEKKVQLPSSVFASEVEESVGLLNKAAPNTSLRLDLDPDIVAAMDEDFDYDDPDNQLEDDFMALANEGSGEEEGAGAEDEDEDEIGSEFDEEEEEEEEEDVDEVASLPEEFNDVETKSRFTSYSLSSSVMRRNDQLSLLDDRFEKVFEFCAKCRGSRIRCDARIWREIQKPFTMEVSTKLPYLRMFEVYDKGEIGALDCEEIEGDISSVDPRLIELATAYCNKQRPTLERDDLKDKILSLVENFDDKEEFETLRLEEKTEKWDCESILSTYSNIYNHPGKIAVPKGPGKIRVNKSGVAVEALDGRNGTKLTARNLAALDAADGGPVGPKSIVSMISELSIRPKNETIAEKKLRKANLREYRRERRIERKANTAAFTQEKLRQEKVLLNLKNNLSGVKIL